MAVMKKKRPMSNEKNLQNLRDKLFCKEKDMHTLKQEVLSLKREIFDLESDPLKEGSHVLMEIAKGRTKKECECVLSVVCDYGEYSFKSIPIKEDGTLSVRSFNVYKDTKLTLV